jgi:hypothetical protein
VDFIKKNFIPVVYVDGHDQPMRDEFLKRVSTHFANEVAVVTPNGEMLSPNWNAEALEKWKKIPAAKRKHLEDLGKYDPELDPQPPANGIIVNVYARALKRDAVGHIQYYQGKANSTKEAGRDHLWLTEKEWRSLLPTRAEEGEKYDVPDPIVQRICIRYVISLANEGGFGGPRAPEQLFAKELHVTVEESSPAMLRLRLAGACRVASARPDDVALGKEAKGDSFQLLGHVTYNPKKKAITRFDLVAYSETGYYDCDSVIKLATPLAVAFQLSPGDSDMERFPPFGFRSKAYFKEYFGEVSPK